MRIASWISKLRSSCWSPPFFPRNAPTSGSTWSRRLSLRVIARRQISRGPSRPNWRKRSNRPASFVTRRRASARPRPRSRADHKGKVPKTMAELHALPGVGRKTANVVLGNAFAVNEGIVVDTHVARLSQRLGLTKAKKSGENRARPDEVDSAEALDQLEPLAHLARSAALLCAQTRLPELRSAEALPFRSKVHPLGERPQIRVEPVFSLVLPP